MRRVTTLLLLVAAFAADGACFAQAPIDHETPGAILATPYAASPYEPSQPGARNAGPSSRPRSAFGKVMAVMIAALQRQSRDGTEPAAAPVRTTSVGTPPGIEVGAAFRDGLDAGDRSEEHATGTGGAVAEPLPRAAPPEDPVLRQATLAGPG